MSFGLIYCCAIKEEKKGKKYRVIQKSMSAVTPEIGVFQGQLLQIAFLNHMRFFDSEICTY